MGVSREEEEFLFFPPLFFGSLGFEKAIEELVIEKLNNCGGKLIIERDVGYNILLY